MFIIKVRKMVSSKEEGRGLHWEEIHAALLGINPDPFLAMNGTLPAVDFVSIS